MNGKSCKWVLGAIVALQSIVVAAPPTAGPATEPSTTRAPDRRYAVDATGSTLQSVVVAKEHCAWPALVQLPDGTLLAVGFNQPSHGRMIGGLDLHASTDGGRTWTSRGTVIAPEPGARQNRMNHAFDRLPDDSLMIICSGWSLKDHPEKADALEIDQVLPAVVARSTDGGHTWSIDRDAFPFKGPDGWALIPYGSIVTAKDGSLCVAAYCSDPDTTNKMRKTYVVRSRDNGKSWTVGPRIVSDESTNETFLWHDGNRRWLAAARGKRLDIHESTDDAHSWQHLGQATENNAVPGHILLLTDGRLVLSHGNRFKHDERVEVRISSDGGRTWSAPARLVDFETFDGGYPSSVQRADGSVVTVYYARQTANYPGFHLGAVVWDPSKTFPQ